MYTTINHARSLAHNAKRQLKCLLPLGLFIAVIMLLSMTSNSQTGRKLLACEEVAPQSEEKVVVSAILRLRLTIFHICKRLEGELTVVKDKEDSKWKDAFMINVGGTKRGLIQKRRHLANQLNGPKTGMNPESEFWKWYTEAQMECIIKNKTDQKAQEEARAALTEKYFNPFIAGIKSMEEELSKLIPEQCKSCKEIVAHDSHDKKCPNPNCGTSGDWKQQLETLQMKNGVLGFETNPSYDASKTIYGNNVMTLYGNAAHTSTSFRKLAAQMQEEIKKVIASSKEEDPSKKLLQEEESTTINNYKTHIQAAAAAKQAKKDKKPEEAKAAWEKTLKFKTQYGEDAEAQAGGKIDNYGKSRKFHEAYEFAQENVEDFQLISRDISAKALNNISDHTKELLSQEPGFPNFHEEKECEFGDVLVGKQTHSFEWNGKKVGNVSGYVEEHEEEPVFFQPRTSVKKPTRALIKMWEKYRMDSSNLTDLFGWHLITLTLQDHMLVNMSILKRFSEVQRYKINRFECYKCEAKTSEIGNDELSVEEKGCENENCDDIMRCTGSSIYDISIACGNKKTKYVRCKNEKCKQIAHDDEEECPTCGYQGDWKGEKIMFMMPNQKAPKTKLNLSEKIFSGKKIMAYTDDKIIFQVTKFKKGRRVGRAQGLTCQGTGKIEMISMPREIFARKSASHGVYDIIRNSGGVAAADMALNALFELAEEAQIEAAKAPRMNRPKSVCVLPGTQNPEKQRLRSQTTANAKDMDVREFIKFSQQLREQFQASKVSFEAEIKKASPTLKIPKTVEEEKKGENAVSFLTASKQIVNTRRLMTTPVLTAIMNNIERS